MYVIIAIIISSFFCCLGGGAGGGAGWNDGVKCADYQLPKTGKMPPSYPYGQ